MLLLHQTGSVKIGETVRYTLTYTPTHDRILPPPQQLHVKIKNTSAIPLRAAYLHGPYTLYTACYPSTFDPYVKSDRVKEEGAPGYEPQLKAGGSWTSTLQVPEHIRASVEDRSTGKDDGPKGFTWIIEVASQVLFSTSATVHYELLVGRDEKSVALGVSGVVPLGSGQGVPGKLEDFQTKRTKLAAEVQTKGVFSKAVRLAIDDTTTLWNTPAFPSWDDRGDVNIRQGPEHGDKRDAEEKSDQKARRQKKIHLVILTHGLHSNVGADMLFMKETIDTAAKQAKEDAKQKRAELRAQKAQEDNEFGRDAAHLKSKSVPDVTIASTELEEEDDPDDEQVIVRGFNGNAVKTERGIQYLGKRLAKYVLSVTYPDQPYLPVKSSISKSITRSFTGQKLSDTEGQQPIHKNSSIVKDEEHVNHNLAYKITGISFIGHSLGGLIQTYAVAYIQKHSPDFFERIAPINFIALATPFLGLSNENPMYVKFALDTGLVGRTGQDLGLTWRAPTIARNGWGAMVNGLVNDPHKNRQTDPGSKPLLRILPTGPAHQALKQFRNRTVYSNVVNDGIVPLRTSCLLFLDWRGLGRVEKARRENGLVGTMVSWGWNEMTGQNASQVKKATNWNEIFSDDSDDGKDSDNMGSTVPDARASQFLDAEDNGGTSEDDSIQAQKVRASSNANAAKEDAQEQESNLWNGFLSWFKPQAGSKTNESASSSSKTSKSARKKKTPKIYKRGQTTGTDIMSDDSDPASPDAPSPVKRSFEKPRGPVRGSSLYTNNSADGSLEAPPPKTSIFESAGDLLAPPLPPQEFLLDPAARPRTIFHDRVYHPDDIPPPPAKRQKTFMKFSGSRTPSRDGTIPNQAHSDLSRISSTKTDLADNGTMRIEEKIARAYHKDMSWRKVLVSMEPDAHNNMIVRRMFANAYGWPVVKHMCDTHFAFTAAAQTRDDEEDTVERAKPQSEAVGSTGEQVEGQLEPPDDEQIKPRSQEEEDSRSRSMDDATRKSDIKVDTTLTSSEQLQNLAQRVKSREQDKSNRSRTASEAREARDEVSDLVSLASNKISPMAAGSFSSAGQAGTEALHRLARQDSARWSDRFFEDSDEGSGEDDAYFAEIKRARERGEFGDIPSSRQERTIDPQSVTANDGKLVAEPESLGSTRRNSLTDVDAQALSLSGVGLGKSTADQLLETNEGERDDSQKGQAGVSEQVAAATGRGQSKS